MGNQLCQATPTRQQQIHDAQNIPIPELSPPIQNYLKNNQPFENQLQKQSHKNKTISYPEGVYCGPTNLMGNPTGYGRLYKNDGSLYIGQFSNGKADGQGILLFKDGSHAKGTFDDNMFIKGSYVSEDFMYTGEFKNNLFHGQGEQMNIKDGYDFIGTFKQGRKVSGTMKWKQDKIDYIYEGQFNPQGQFVNGGKLTEQTMGYYVGDYKQNKKHGKGVYEYENGIKYVGEYVDGKKEGAGTLYNGDGSVSYEGLFKNGLPHGAGKAYNKQGKAVEAQWIEGIDQELISS